MVVAVNTRFLKDDLEDFGYFIKETFSRLTQQYPQHRFYFLFDRSYDEQFIFSDNVTPVIISPPATHPLLRKYWYDVKLPWVLKKIKAEVYVSLDGFTSLTTKVPQCVVVQDLGFLQYPEAYKKSHILFYKRYMPRFLKKAKAIATVSLFSKNDIIKHYNIPPQKIHVVYSAAKEIFQPTGWQLHEAIKEKYTEGTAYFIYIDTIHSRKNLINLLKGFSVFKKRQKSNMKLVLAGKLAWKNEAFLHLLKTYKYKDDVVLTGYIPENEVVALMGAAYALVYPSAFEGFGVPVLKAMKCNVPVLTAAHTAMQEIGEEAALYFDPAQPADIADKLMLIYKDENLRTKLIELGKTVAQKYSWQRTADLLWQSITNAVNN